MFRSMDLAWPVRTVVIIRDRRSGASQVSNTSDLLHITQTILPRISWHGILDPSRLASPRFANVMGKRDPLARLDPKRCQLRQQQQLVRGPDRPVGWLGGALRQ